MYKNNSDLPSVMSISINDPSGASGIQADIEAISAMGGHCTSILAGLAIKNTSNVFQITPLPSELVWHQAKAILEDMPISVIKIGFLGSIETIQIVHNLLKDYPRLPLILAPNLLLQANNQKPNQDIIDALIELILPKTEVCIIEEAEARLLAQQADTLEACAQSIMAHGANYALITGQCTAQHPFTNTLYGNYRQLDTIQWDLKKYDYAGINCTLSSSLAALIAQGMTTTSALHQAQAYTEKSLKYGYRLGMGQQLPNRLFWARESLLCEATKKFNQ